MITMSAQNSRKLWCYPNIYELSLMCEDSHDEILASLQ